MYILAVDAFIYRIADAWSGSVIVALLAWLRGMEVRRWPAAVRLGKYAPSAAALGAYVLAYCWTIGSPPAYREACGWEAAFGVMGGINVLGGIAKLWDAGLDWFDSRNIGLLLAERAFEGPPAARALRRAIVAQPFLCRAFAVYALASEFGCVLLVFPAARLPCIAAITLLQLGFAVFLNFFQYEWIFVTVALYLCAWT